MQAFTHHEGFAVALSRRNIDTDQIVPARFLHRPRAEGYGDVLFRDLKDKGGFALDAEESDGATILVSGDNFGCGSSREHAVWALADAGFRVVIAPSYGDIFYNNSMKNGLMTVRLPADEVEALAAAAPTIVAVDLSAQTVSWGDRTILFKIEQHHREALLEGLSEVAMTLREATTIADFERRHFAAAPWLSLPSEA